MWNREEQHRLFDFWGKSKGDADAILGLASLAVELVAARGGTMTAERITDLRESMVALKQKHPAIAEEIGEALRHITSQGATVAMLQAENERLKTLLGNFDKRCADALADEVSVLVQQHIIDARSPAADALLDYRNPPSTERTDRIASLQAKVAELEKERDGQFEDFKARSDDYHRTISRMASERDRDFITIRDLRAEVERLKAVYEANEGLVRKVEALERENHHLREDWTTTWRERAETAESRLAAIRERAKSTEEIRRRFVGALASHCTPEAAALVIALWVWEADGLEGDAPQDAKTCAWGGGECGNAAPAPCGFCNFHCGHARGICAGFGKRYPCSPTCTHDDAATPGHPERVKERSEAVRHAACDHGNCRTHPCEMCPTYDRGAEAMRAACLSEIDTACDTAGLHRRDRLRQALKAAIEGVAP